jgi:dihydroxyacid dehydratase/phosphogluconate dehydratase
LIARIDSAVFNSATHFARVIEEVAVQDGDVFIVRHEGARQAFEDVITITLE